MPNLSWKTCGVVSPTTKLFPSISRRYPAQTQKIFGGYPPRHRIYLKILCERYAIKQSVKGNCLPNKLRMEISSKQIPKETSTKEYLEKPAYQKKLKRHLGEKNLKRKLFPNMVQTISLPKIISKNYTEEALKTHSLPNKHQKNNLYQNISQETFLFQKVEETSLRKKHLKRNLYQKE